MDNYKTQLEREIEKIREGCGEKTEDEEFDLDCGEEIDNPDSESGCSFLLCDKCREKLIKAEAKLEGYNKARKEELEFLKNLNSLTPDRNNQIKERIKELKNGN